MPPEYLEMDQCVMTPAGGVWSFGMMALVSQLNIFGMLSNFPQELFIRKRSYGHLWHPGMITSHILLKEREPPSLEDTCSRLTDEWWKMCSSCWTRDPLQRPSMLTVLGNLQVHHRYGFPTSDILPVSFFCRLRPQSALIPILLRSVSLFGVH